MDENQFWSMIEAAWATAGGKAGPRRRLAEGRLSEEGVLALEEALEEVVPVLQQQLAGLPAGELLEFDSILERKLYDIDRADVQKRTDGSDDGFLYCRGFIVAMGRQYYEAVRTDPAVAVMEAECEDMCYLSWHLYEERFDKVPPSAISRESGSNQAGWPADD